MGRCRKEGSDDRLEGRSELRMSAGCNCYLHIGANVEQRPSLGSSIEKRELLSRDHWCCAAVTGKSRANQLLSRLVSEWVITLNERPTGSWETRLFSFSLSLSYQIHIVTMQANVAVAAGGDNQPYVYSSRQISYLTHEKY